MYKKIKKEISLKNNILRIGFFLIICNLFTFCKTENKEKELQYYKVAGFTQGTTYHITYSDTINYRPKIEKILKDFSRSLSTYDKTSLISGLNKNKENVALDNFFISVFNKSQEISEKTNGYFDATVAPVVNAWGFGFSKKEKITKELIDSIKQYTGYKTVKIQNNRLVKKHKQTMLDFNAIAQGYSVDVVADFLDEKGIENYMIEIGGELITKGKNPDNRDWKIGIDKPIEHSQESNRKIQAVVKLNNKALATSGSYRKFYEKNGIKYSHTINPKTGYPVQHNLLSVTVVAEDCISADAYATAFMVMGLEKSIKFVENTPSLEAYFISAKPNGGYEIYYTNGMKKMILN